MAGLDPAISTSTGDATDGPGKPRTTPGAGGAAAQLIDPAGLGPAFPRTHHVLMLEFGDRKD